MRCHYLSDLHLEAQDFTSPLPGGDVLILAGDLCHARCLDPARADRYCSAQRDRTLRFVDEALGKFAHVLLVAGNHEHYDGIFDDTVATLLRHLPGVTVLDGDVTEIGGVRFFGTTLWCDFGGLSDVEITAIRKGMGEYFFVKMRPDGANGAGGPLVRLTPAATHRAHRSAWARLREAVTMEPRRPTVVVTHHAPSGLGLNPRFTNSPLNAAYASNLDDEIAAFANVPVWIHGHTHIARTYRIADTIVRSNALGFASKGAAAPGFSTGAHFEMS
ncbi:MAG: metallophosphoesterase [Hyphomicrobiaceae bacterium]|nr:metallophosphoesterase [Hyphomicrobiaceae bacterium]